MYNKCLMIGHLTRDPELKTVGQSTLCKFTIAMNHRTKEKEEVCFVDIAAWGKQGEFVSQYFKKGSQILVEGRLKQESWEKDGKQHTKHTIHAEKISFVGGPSERQERPQEPMLNESKRIFPSDRKEMASARYEPVNGQKTIDGNNLDLDKLPF